MFDIGRGGPRSHIDENFREIVVGGGAWKWPGKGVGRSWASVQHRIGSVQDRIGSRFS